jgi:nucleotide-binding universal stress UspA family protein
MYSLSASKGDFRPLQATAAPETVVLASAPAIPRSNSEAMGISARMVVDQLPPSVPLSAAKDHDDSPPHIYLHIQSPAQHEAAQRLVAQLQQKGYIIPKAVTLVPKGPSRTEVRYFSPTEAEEAAAIAVLLHQPYHPPATSSYVRGRKDTSRNRHRRYEVWLGPEPRSRRTAQ